MKHTSSIFVLLAILGCFIFPGNPVIAQPKAGIENVEFFVEGDQLIINYDIVNAVAAESYDIRIKVLTLNRDQLPASSLHGDIGPGVSGGNHKRISWDLVKDNVTIDDEIFVEVSFKPANYYLPEKQVNKVSIGGAMLRSLALPGLGNTYAKGGGAYWLIGLAAYGTLGASVYFNNQAYNNYEDYKITTDPTERNQLYDDASKQYDTQKQLMYVAGAIWLADIIWTGLQAHNINKKANRSNVSLGYYYDPAARAPMFSLSYNLK